MWPPAHPRTEDWDTTMRSNTGMYYAPITRCVLLVYIKTAGGYLYILLASFAKAFL
jgi:hypothetical protein